MNDTALLMSWKKALECFYGSEFLLLDGGFSIATGNLPSVSIDVGLFMKTPNRPFPSDQTPIFYIFLCKIIIFDLR